MHPLLIHFSFASDHVQTKSSARPSLFHVCYSWISLKYTFGLLKFCQIDQVMGMQNSKAYRNIKFWLGLSAFHVHEPNNLLNLTHINSTYVWRFSVSRILICIFSLIRDVRFSRLMEGVCVCPNVIIWTAYVCVQYTNRPTRGYRAA
jgi:hypothetical protein